MSDNDTEPEATEPPKKTGVVRQFVEMVGRHPFATGLLGLLAIVGFALSVVGFGIDRSEARSTTDQVAEVGANVEKVVDTLSAECTSPPCWQLTDLMQSSTIGRPKDLLDRKLPPADRISDGQYWYRMQDCSAVVEYRGDAVSYVSASVFRIQKLDDGTYEKVACPFNPLTIQSFEPEDASSAPPAELATLKDIVDLRRGDVRIANACVDCGNYAEPYIEFVQRGPHSSNFIDLYAYVAWYDSAPGTDDYDSWTEMENNFLRRIDSPDQYYTVETPDLCEFNVAGDVGPIADHYVARVGLGKGTRQWSGPRSLYCY